MSDNIHTRVFLCVETEIAGENNQKSFVLGVYSTKENAQAALLKSMREHIENDLQGASFEQSVDDRGILIKTQDSCNVYNIIDRILDE